MKPNVSVILTVYNTEKYLKKCLDSLIKQSLKNIEIICIDDASDDASVAILHEYKKSDKRIQIIEFSTNKGANFARNTALKKVNGEYVVILDADDFYERTFLEKLYLQAKKTQADITFCGFDLYDNETQKIQKILWDINRELLPKSEIFSLEPELFDLLPSFVWNQMYKYDFIKENNLFFADIKCYTDVYFNKTALLKAKRISYVDEKLVYYRVNNKDSISHNLTYSGAIRTIYALASFLKKENLFEKYQDAFFITSLLKMKRIVKIPEPYCSLLRSFYQKHLIHKFWDNMSIPNSFSLLAAYDNCSDAFKRFFFQKREKILPIVMNSNDEKLPQTAVTIQSIIENINTDYFYDIYVLGDNLSAIKCFNLTLLSNNNFRITYINTAERYYKKIDFERDLSYIPELFDGYDKLLYLSDNILVTSDLTDLFKTDMKKNLVATRAVNLTAKKIKYYQKIFKWIPIQNISCEVILFNLGLLKQRKLINDFIQAQEINKKTTKAEILNFACKNKILFLPQTCNETQKIRKIGIKKNKSDFIFYDDCLKDKSENSFTKKWRKNAKKSVFYEFLQTN